MFFGRSKEKNKKQIDDSAPLRCLSTPQRQMETNTSEAKSCQDRDTAAARQMHKIVMCSESQTSSFTLFYLLLQTQQLASLGGSDDHSLIKPSPPKSTTPSHHRVSGGSLPPASSNCFTRLSITTSNPSGSTHRSLSREAPSARLLQLV